MTTPDCHPAPLHPAPVTSRQPGASASLATDDALCGHVTVTGHWCFRPIHHTVRATTTLPLWPLGDAVATAATLHMVYEAEHAASYTTTAWHDIARLFGYLSQLGR